MTGNLFFGEADGAFFTSNTWHGTQFQNMKISSVTLGKNVSALPIGIFKGCKDITTFTSFI